MKKDSDLWFVNNDLHTEGPEGVSVIHPSPYLSGEERGTQQI